MLGKTKTKDPPLIPLANRPFGKRIIVVDGRERNRCAPSRQSCGANFRYPPNQGHAPFVRMGLTRSDQVEFRRTK
jgi:hypothetical protein